MRKTLWREESARLHDRYAKVQNRMRGHSLSSSPPSSVINVDGVGLANMPGDLLGKKSKLNLRLFSVGIPVVGRMVMP